MSSFGEGLQEGIEAGVAAIVGGVLTVVLQSVIYTTGAPSIYALYYILILLVMDIISIIALTQKALSGSLGYLLGRIIGTFYGIRIVTAAGFSTLSLWISLFLCIVILGIRIWLAMEK